MVAEAIEVCQIQRDLFDQLSDARSLYAAATRKLQDQRASLDSPTIDQAEAARDLYIAARNNLEGHIRKHGCVLSDSE